MNKWAMLKLVMLMVLAALVVAPAADVFAQAAFQAPREVGKSINPDSPGPDFINFYGIAPGNVAGLNFILAVSNLLPSGNAIKITTIPFPFSSFFERTDAYFARETKFFNSGSGSPNVSCVNTVCELFISVPADAFTFDSLLIVVDAGGNIVAILSPFRFFS